MATSGTNPAPTRPPAPIVLVSRGPCDARLIVFDQEYHVHSDVLKLQSEYFFKFLDSPDKENLPSTETRFKYEWVTKVDDDGEGWMLTCAGPKAGELNHSSFKLSKDYEIAVFTKFLRALYDLPYEFEMIEELVTLTQFAGFYRSLPRISRSVGPAIHGSSVHLKFKMQHFSKEIMKVALELRHKELLKDSFIYACGSRFQCEEYPILLSDIPLLEELQCKVGSKLQLQIASVYQTLLDETSRHHRDGRNDMDKVWVEMGQAARMLPGPASTFRIAHDKLLADASYAPWSDSNYTSTMFFSRMDRLMSNDLHFYPQVVSGTGSGVVEESKNFNDFFLCNFLEDDDIPWDTAETLW